MPEDIKYDEHGGIVNTEVGILKNAVAKKKSKNGYNFFERLILKYSRKVNYLLDKDGKYLCRNERTPQIIRIGPTNRCTARCVYCPREFIHAGGTGYMDFDLYRRIIDWAKANNVKIIGLAFFGEPLIHPQIIDMIDYAQKSGLSARLSTNGIALNKDLANKILDYHSSAIEISMDGYNEKEYFEGKQVNKFNEAKANILYLLDRAKEKKSEAVFNIHFVDAGNVSFFNKLRFIKFWRKKLEGLNSATSFYYEPHNWAGTRNNIRDKMSFLDRALSSWELKKPCVYINSLNINWNGNVQICSNDPTEIAVIGNINNSDFEEVYNGERRLNYLEENEKGSFKDLNCGICTVNSIFPLLFLKKKLLNIIVKVFS
jgi:radical SAM protein with 4Fe4S-binding SPASM domain